MELAQVLIDAMCLCQLALAFGSRPQHIFYENLLYLSVKSLVYLTQHCLLCLDNYSWCVTDCFSGFAY